MEQRSEFCRCLPLLLVKNGVCIIKAARLVSPSIKFKVMGGSDFMEQRLFGVRLLGVEVHGVLREFSSTLSARLNGVSRFSDVRPPRLITISH
jgi:hypothetical protein